MKKMSAIAMFIIAITACNTNANKEAAIQQAKQQTIDSIQAIAEKQHIIDSITAVAKKDKEAESATQARVSTTSEANTTVQTAPTTVTKKKKGLNATATGALVGVGVGAITGAMVDGKKGEGAIVGGLIGGAAGAGTGAIIDAKKKKKAASN